jgi:putative redox protein
MAEIVVVRQNSKFETEFLAADTEAQDEAGRDLHHVHAIHELSPYGLLLVSLGACTAILLHSYAQNHSVKLQEVEMRMTYGRVFAQDCKECEEKDKYAEGIDAEVGFVGGLSPAERDKLFLISQHCPVHKILRNGIQTEFRLKP